jgi:hypothetical protein
MECNKTFSEIVHIQWDRQYNQFFEQENLLQVALANALAVIPGFAGNAGLVDNVARQASDVL